ncbi:MAG: rane-associated protein in eicosanoid and glutathione metabolism [Rhodospirillales bacterium]|jgi:glutathione S-transferase|nr:rane-associated protein in eicosanoid and glutathione metabolism [Rhodospirillales bacterium]
MLPLLPSMATALAVLLFLVLTLNVSRARGRYGVKAPSVAGDPAFERVFRVQQNTLEQIVIFLPALWLFARFMSETWAGIIGLVWIVGRLLYAWGYYRGENQRGPGYAITVACSIILLIGAFVGMFIRY